MLAHGNARVFEGVDPDLVRPIRIAHVFLPQLAQGLIDPVPGSPPRPLAKLGRRLPEIPLKGAGEALGPFVPARHGDIDNLCIAKGELIGGPLQAAELDVAVDTQAEELGELSM